MIKLTEVSIDQKEIKEVIKVFKSGYLVQGKNVERFEKRAARYVGTKYAVAVSSGTAALHLALLALDIKNGDEVIIPAYTFPATANVVEMAGAKPVFVDIDLNTFNIDTKKIEKRINSRTKAIIPVHLFGLPVDMDGILQIAKKYKLYIIEDAACALGAEYNKRRCGGFGDIGCFSFHPRKVITTGEGGMVVTNTKKIAERISALRNHGKQNISFNLAGLNYRMTDFQGAIGWVQMERIEYLIKERIRLAGYYDKILRSIDGILIPAVKGDKRHVYQSYVILLDRKLNRDKIIKQLKGKGIEATIGTYALHTLPYYSKKYNYRLEDFPNSYKAFKNSIALPLHPKMKQNDAAKITDILIKLIKR